MLIIQSYVNTSLSDSKGFSFMFEIDVVGTSFRGASHDLTLWVSVECALSLKVHHVSALVLVYVVQFSNFQELRLLSHFSLTVLLLELRSIAHLVKSTFLGLSVLNKHLILTKLVFIKSLTLLIFTKNINILSLSNANLSLSINHESHFLVFRVDVKSGTFTADGQNSSLGIVVTTLVIDK